MPTANVPSSPSSSVQLVAGGARLAFGERHTVEEEARLSQDIHDSEADMARLFARSAEALAELGRVGREIEDGAMRARDALREGDAVDGKQTPEAPRLMRALRDLGEAARERLGGDASEALADGIAELRLHRRVLDRVASAVAREAPVADDLRRAAARADRSKAELVAANLHVAIAVARRHRRRGVDVADLIQEGSIGLLRACDKFDHARGHRFGTYASFWARQQIARALVEHATSIRVPLAVAAARQRVALTQRTFELKHGRVPTPSELTLASGLEPSLLATVNELVRDPVSLDATSREGGRELVASIADDRVPRPDDALDDERMKARMRALLGKLDAREASILSMRFGLGDTNELTLREVGERVSLSRERVRRIADGALRKLAALTEGEDFASYLVA